MKDIKYIIIKIWNLTNSFIYTFLKLLKTKNKITFISRQTNNENIDFNLIVEELKEQDESIKTIVLNRKIGKTIISKIKYIFHMYRQMYHIATSKTVILDGYCIAISNLKHKRELKVIQIWHALGALKKFGYSILDKNEGSEKKMAICMNMHKNYTYVLTSSENSKKYFQEAFNVREEQVKVMPLPRVDFLQSKYYEAQTKEKFYNYYSEINNQKQKILYVPTFRKKSKNIFKNLVNKVNYEKYDLIIKTHDDTELVYTSKDKFYSKGTDFTGMELLHIADYVITDYSAIVFEAAVANKPIYFYNYDYKKYIKNRGFYIDYINEMPGLITNDVEKLMGEIEADNFDYKELREFKEKYIYSGHKNNVKALVDLIIKEMPAKEDLNKKKVVL